MGLHVHVPRSWETTGGGHISPLQDFEIHVTDVHAILLWAELPRHAIAISCACLVNHITQDKMRGAVIRVVSVSEGDEQE